ncbi:MAG: prepilin-type N-terminal cleavage/methylation domain-containing protein [Candidatus Omnitrophica bacterium]|nr:prepilin-type N-terminal cleavage/methylation domain-containing protein [Candidatus Omnitrophota bacterium]
MRTLKSRGFTLVEVMMVVILIGILASIGIPTYKHSVEVAKCSQGMAVLASMRNAELDWFRENQVFSIDITGELEPQVAGSFADTIDWDFNTIAPAAGFDGNGNPTLTLTAIRLGGPHAAVGNDILTIDQLGIWGGSYPYDDPGAF